MADVDSKTQGGGVDVLIGEGLEQFIIALERVDQHARLGLEGEDHVMLGCEFEYFGNSVDKARKCFGPPRPIVNDAGPNRNAAGIEASGDLNRAAEKVDSSITGIRVWRDQRWFVLIPRVEQKPGARLDHALK